MHKKEKKLKINQTGIANASVFLTDNYDYNVDGCVCEENKFEVHQQNNFRLIGEVNVKKERYFIKFSIFCCCGKLFQFYEIEIGKNEFEQITEHITKKIILIARYIDFKPKEIMLITHFDIREHQKLPLMISQKDFVFLTSSNAEIKKHFFDYCEFNHLLNVKKGYLPFRSNPLWKAIEDDDEVDIEIVHLRFSNELFEFFSEIIVGKQNISVKSEKYPRIGRKTKPKKEIIKKLYNFMETTYFLAESEGFVYCFEVTKITCYTSYHFNNNKRVFENKKVLFMFR